MPALKLIRCCGSRRGLTTRPFAGDDLQILCCFMAAYRVIQMACIVPFWIKLYLFRLHGRNYVGPNGQPSWCVDVTPINLITTQMKFIDSAFSNGTWHSLEDQDSNLNEASKSIIVSFTFYLAISLIYNVLDIALSLAIWSATSVGTPTEPRGRDTALRSLIWVKFIFMNLLLVIVLGSGIYLVAEGRRTNYGCGEEGDDMVHHFEGTPWYAMFCVVMVTYAFELLLCPCMIMNQVGKSITSETSKSRLYGFIVNKERSHRNTAACIGGCLQCLRCLSCNRLGGGKIRAQTDLKDASVAFMDFFNFNDKFDIVLSDVWIAFKMLGRVHRERKYKSSQQARFDKQSKSGEQLVPSLDLGFINENNDSDRAADDSSDENDLFVAEDNFSNKNAKRNYHPNVPDEDGNDTSTTRKTVLRHTRASDMHHIHQAARFSHYAMGVYDLYPDALLAAGQINGGRSGVYNPTQRGESHSNGTDGISLSSCFRLTDFGFPETALAYGTFANDILATPYSILVDEDARTVIVSIRGTATLEDMVTDLQFSSVAMERVGEVCGFDGKGTYSHRGMLTKSKWIYNDLTRRKILARLLPTDDSGNSNNPCHNFNLIFTGHSLGAGIAAILGTMFRPTYPELKCYAFCPPGCSVSINLALQCEDYVTSIVVGHDLVPRIRGSNFEMLRFEFLEILARIKVPKIKAWRDTRIPCKNKDLVVRNKRLLYSKNEIPMSSYFTELKSFQQKRRGTFSELVETNLHIPGRIIHLVNAIDCSGNKNKYLPYWESSKSLREIDLSIEVMKEHSIDNLVIILNKIATDYDNASKGIHVEDDDDDSVEPVEHNSFDEILSGSDFSADDRWFILCSRPNGSVSLIPTLLSIAAFCCAAFGNNTCSLFIREVEDGEIFHKMTMGGIEDVAGVTFGLYSYGIEYYHGDVDGYVLQCSQTIPFDVKNDVYIKMARAFSALAFVVGFPVICFLGLANCCRIRRKWFRRIAVAIFFVTFSQSMIFIFLLSDRCYQDLFPNLSGVDSQPCRLDNGSKMSVASSVMWFLAAVFTTYIDRASIVEGQMKMLSMHVTNRINDQ